MNILVIDAQGGGIGRQLVSAIKSQISDTNITAIGTNSLATQAMIKAGADKAATGENSVIVCAPKADVIIGPIGIVIANSMLGEITSAMAEAVGNSDATRILIPTMYCNTRVAGVVATSVGEQIQQSVDMLKNL